MLIFLALFLLSSSSLATIHQFPLTAHRIPRQNNRIKLQASNITINSSFSLFLMHFRNYTQHLVGVYAINVKIGTPPQEFVVQLDNLIGDFWVVGKDCFSEYCRKEYEQYLKHLYDWTKSSTFVDDGRRFEVEFASGKYAKDSVMIGEITIESQIFGAANKIENELYYPIDGILGIGWSADDTVPNILQGLDSTKRLNQSVITTWLDRQPKQYPLANNGLLTIGGFDEQNCKNDWTFQPLNSDFYWQFYTDGFEIGKFSQKRQKTAITLIAEPFIFLSDSELDFVVKSTGAIFNDEYGYLVPCRNVPNLPNMTFIIADKDYTVTADDYVDSIPLPGNYCQLLVNESDDEFFYDIFVLGQPFLRSFCHAFDWLNHQIALASSIRN